MSLMKVSIEYAPNGKEGKIYKTLYNQTAGDHPNFIEIYDHVLKGYVYYKLGGEIKAGNKKIKISRKDIYDVKIK